MSLTNPQNSETKILRIYEVDMLKIILDYILNNFTSPITNIIVDDGEIFLIKNELNFCKKIYNSHKPIETYYTFYC